MGSQRREFSPEYKDEAVNGDQHGPAGGVAGRPWISTFWAPSEAAYSSHLPGDHRCLMTLVRDV